MRRVWSGSTLGEDVQGTAGSWRCSVRHPSSSLRFMGLDSPYTLLWEKSIQAFSNA